VIDSFDKIDRITGKSKVKHEYEPTRKSIMDELLKETFESPENFSNAFLKTTSTFDFDDKNKTQSKVQNPEEEEDVLENVIKSFEKKENLGKNDEDLQDPEDLIKQFEENEKV